MSNTYTALIKQDGNWWIGWIEEIPGVNCQENTHEELIMSLTVTLKEALELNRYTKRTPFFLLAVLLSGNTIYERTS